MAGVIVFVIARIRARCRSLAKFTSSCMEVEEISPFCQTLRDLCEQPENRQRISEEIYGAQKSGLPFYVSMHRNRLHDCFPILHTCMQVASRMSRETSSGDVLSYDQTWCSSFYDRVLLASAKYIVVLDISNLDAWEILLGEFEEPLVITGKRFSGGHHNDRKWRQIPEAKLQDWVSIEDLYLEFASFPEIYHQSEVNRVSTLQFDFAGVDDVPVENPPTKINSLYSLAAKKMWKEDRDGLLHLPPLLRERWLKHMASEHIDITGSSLVVPFLRSLLPDLSSVDLRAMKDLTPKNITDLARTCGSGWTSLDLSRHGNLQGQDIILIMKYACSLRRLYLGNNYHSTLQLPEILQAADKKCHIEHPGLYCRYFEERQDRALSLKPLIGQMVVAEIGDGGIYFKIAGAADEYISLLRCYKTFKRLPQAFKDNHPATQVDTMVLIENAFALEEDNVVQPMLPFSRRWTQAYLNLFGSPRYNLDSWTLLVLFRKRGVPTFKYSFAKFNDIKKRKRCEIDASISNIVIGGLDMVAKTDGLDTTLDGMNLDDAPTWTDRCARKTFLGVFNQISRHGLSHGLTPASP